MKVIKCKVRNKKEYKDILVDDENYEELSKFNWREDMNGYPIRSQYIKGDKNRKNIYMHKVILNKNDELVVDHIDGNVCNNQKYNLRLCSIQENSRNRKKQKNNTTGYTGVTFSKIDNMYYARICFNKKQTHIGCYKTAKEAYEAYCEKAKELFGEFARL